MTVICQHCGAEFERNPEETHRQFCSPECYRKFKAQDRYFTCPHNEAIGCEQGKKKCYRCGGNPAVEKHRKGRLVGI